MRAKVLLLLTIGWICACAPVFAQEETPGPTPEDTGCQIGELCTNVNTETSPEEEAGPINDPAGDVRTSLLTMGFIALVVGVYFFIALTGRGLRGPFRSPGRKA